MSSPTRRILATSGGFLATDVQGVVRPGGILAELLRLTNQERPRLLLVNTATGDDSDRLLRAYRALASWSVAVSHLALFPQPSMDPRQAVMESDAVWVGGGSVANLLACWRVHGLDKVFAEAHDAGVVLGGVSAGSICWHVGGTTDSFGPALRPVTNALGLIGYGNGVHYDSEAQRRPLLHGLVRDAVLPTSIATDDGCGVLYENGEPAAVVTDVPGSPARAYRVELMGGRVVETVLEPGRL